jgi:K+-transporting ATPase c subunit
MRVVSGIRSSHMSNCRLSDDLAKIRKFIDNKRFIDAKSMSFDLLYSAGGLSPYWTKEEAQFIKTIVAAQSHEEMEELLEWV